jgi:hypothetical protein
MRRVVLALLLAIVPIAEAQAARVDQLIEEMARRNRAQDEAERREGEAEERRPARAEPDAAPSQRAHGRRTATRERDSKPAPRPVRADATRGAPREAYRSGGRGSGGCGSRASQMANARADGINSAPLPATTCSFHEAHIARV